MVGRWLSKISFAISLLVASSFSPFAKADEHSSRLLTFKENRLVLNKAALGKQFFLDPLTFSQTGVRPYESRIISFELRNHELFVFESTAGFQSNNSITPKFLMGTLPITSQTQNEIEFEFKPGRLNDYTVSTSINSTENVQYGNVYSVSATLYLDSIEETAPNRLTLTFLNTDHHRDPESAFQQTYIIEPVIRQATFKSTWIEKNDRFKFSFIDVGVRFNGTDGEVRSPYIKANLAKTMVYEVASNTTQRTWSAILRAMAYWNRLLGIEYFKLARAAAGARFPDPSKNFILWLNLKSANEGVSRNHADSETGEIRRNYIFLPSKMDRVIRLNLISSNWLLANKHIPTATIEARISQMTEDYIAYAVAHELGHALGFGHNFAGSLDSKIDFSTLSNTLDQFILTGTLPENLEITGTVMDYFSGMWAAMVGKTLNAKSYRYDQMVADVVYFGKDGFSAPNTKWPSFCDEQQLKSHADCLSEPNDIGTSLFERLKWMQRQRWKRVGYEVLKELAVFYFETRNTTRRELPEPTINFSNFSTQLNAERTRILNHISTYSYRDIQPNYFVSQTEVNPALEERFDSAKYKLNELRSVGGIGQFLYAYAPYLETAKTTLINRLNHPGFTIETEKATYTADAAFVEFAKKNLDWTMMQLKQSFARADSGNYGLVKSAYGWMLIGEDEKLQSDLETYFKPPAATTKLESLN